MIPRAKAALAVPLLTLLSLSAALGVADAHGGGPGLDYDPCTRAAGPGDIIHFAAYQPQFNPFAEYCDTLPRSGTTLLVFDLMGTELPDDPLSLAVVQEHGAVHLQVPPQRYRAGVVKLETDLPPGRYTVFVRVTDPDGLHRLVFPVQVGAWWAPLVLPLLFTVMITAAAVCYCIYQMRRMTAERQHPAVKTPREIVPRRA